ncbi:MAG TPA: glycerate kinase, partial [Pasteurellaceae bacterium]|nr:glycerate kinase [Pasteurellaceae bacterium]
VMELLALEEKMKGADLVITGEGRIDHQSINGKVVVGVAALAQKLGIPVIGIGGSLGQDIEVVYDHGLNAVFSVLNKVCTLPEALAEAEKNLEITARNIAAVLKMQIA